MDFDAFMQKKLGGKYLKPIQAETEVADIIESDKDLAEEIILTPPPKGTPPKNKPRGRKGLPLSPG